MRRIADVALETFNQSQLPYPLIAAYTDRKVELIMIVLASEIFPYDAGILRTEWRLWRHHCHAFLYDMEIDREFHAMLTYILDGFLHILCHNKHNKRHDDARTECHFQRAEGLTVSH